MKNRANGDSARLFGLCARHTEVDLVITKSKVPGRETMNTVKEKSGAIGWRIVWEVQPCPKCLAEYPAPPIPPARIAEPPKMENTPKARKKFWTEFMGFLRGRKNG